MAYLVGRCGNCGSVFSNYGGELDCLLTLDELREVDPDYTSEADTRAYILHHCPTCLESTEFIVIPSLSDL